MISIMPAGTLVLIALLLSVPRIATGQEAAAPPTRYSITPSDGGFVRLDTETGTVSHCFKREGTWLCEPAEENQVADERAAQLGAAIDALGARLDRLAKDVAALGGRIDALSSEDADPPSPEVVTEPPALTPGSTKEPTASESLASRLLRPLIGLVSDLKRGQSETE